jgi:hypothetical protein
VHNDFFALVTWPGLLSGIPLLGSLVKAAYQITLASGTFAFLLIALPCALASRLAAGHPWTAVLVPAGVLASFFGWVTIFVFSNLDPVRYLQTSYDRLVMVPTFGAILYSAESLALATRSGDA